MTSKAADPDTLVAKGGTARVATVAVELDQPAREPVSLGRAVPFSRHPLPSAWHATPVTLEPGRATELLLRVQTRSTMVLPLTLATLGGRSDGKGYLLYTAPIWVEPFCLKCHEKDAPEQVKRELHPLVGKYLK